MRRKSAVGDHPPINANTLIPVDEVRAGYGADVMPKRLKQLGHHRRHRTFATAAGDDRILARRGQQMRPLQQPARRRDIACILVKTARRPIQAAARLENILDGRVHRINHQPAIRHFATLSPS